MNMEEDIKNFFESYLDGTKLEAPTIYRAKYGIELQFCGWCICLDNDGSFILEDTTGG